MNMRKIPIEKLILALDFPDLKHCEEFFQKCSSKIKTVKIGMELFYKEGVSAMNWAQEKKLDVFLDLKLHDIPNTIYRSCLNLLRFNPKMLTIHTIGGIEMMKAAVKAKHELGGQCETLLLGVTVLTSIDEDTFNHELKMNNEMTSYITHLAKLASIAELDGVVASCHEVSAIIDKTHDKFCVVTPGIQTEMNQNYDQKRVANPTKAIELGSSYLVIGRGITRANNPTEVINKFFYEERE